MDLLTARSRCIFFVMSTNPIQVLKQTELLGHQFTVYGTAENPLFLTKEVADIIEYSASNSSKLTNLVDRDEKVRNIITTPGGNQEVWLLTEDGLYEVLFQSRKPIAKEFKKGVKEILKTIRKTGGYIATKQDDTPEEIMARALIVAQETIKRKEERLKQLEEKNAKLKPKADFAEAAFKKILFSFGNLLNCCTFAVRQFYIHIWIGDFLCPILNYCPKYKQRFLRTYSPQADMELSQVGEILCFLYLLTFNFHCLCDS